MSNEEIDQMCPACRSSAHAWIVEVNERVARINRASKWLQLSTFILGASLMLTALVVIAWCLR